MKLSTTTTTVKNKATGEETTTFKFSLFQGRVFPSLSHEIEKNLLWSAFMVVALGFVLTISTGFGTSQPPIIPSLLSLESLICFLAIGLCANQLITLYKLISKTYQFNSTPFTSLIKFIGYITPISLFIWFIFVGSFFAGADLSFISIVSTTSIFAVLWIELFNADTDTDTAIYTKKTVAEHDGATEEVKSSEAE